MTFKIDEGPQYRFGKIDIKSSLKAADPAALRGALHTQSGDIFDADAVNKTVEDMTIALAKTGEPFASVSPRVERIHRPAPWTQAPSISSIRSARASGSMSSASTFTAIPRPTTT